MAAPTSAGIASVFSNDVLLLIFDYFKDDSTTLASACRTCRAWHSIALPVLLHDVDLSSHNNGRLPDREDHLTPIIYADYDGSYRQENLVTRQRAFLRTMTEKPQLTSLVKSFTWTLVWLDFEEIDLAEIDRQTWSVFGRLTRVHTLDLASLHDIGDEDFIRQNPARLFPAVTSLRLLGYMHRGLIKAILDSLDTSLLRTLTLDNLLDEGLLHKLEPMPEDVAKEYAPSSQNGHVSTTAMIDDDLHSRQDSGKACIFPGPMWLPLRILCSSSLDSLTTLQLKLGQFAMENDLRNYNTFFHEAAKLVFRGRHTLRSLTIIFGEARSHFLPRKPDFVCGTGWRLFHSINRPRCIEMAASFLNQILKALNQADYPCLTSLKFQGFRLLHNEQAARSTSRHVEDVWRSIRECQFQGVDFTETEALDGRHLWNGFDYRSRVDPLELVDKLRNS